MKTSPTVDKVLPALLQLKQTLKTVSKDASNPHYRSKYADLPSLLEEVEPKAQEAGLILSQASEFRNERLSVVTRLTHAGSGQWVESEWPVLSSKEDAQSYGSAGTYARRFSLKGLLAIREEDDDGNAATGKSAVVKTAAPPQEPTTAPVASAAKEAGKSDAPTQRFDRKKAAAALKATNNDEL